MCLFFLLPSLSFPLPGCRCWQPPHRGLRAALLGGSSFSCCALLFPRPSPVFPFAPFPSPLLPFPVSSASRAGGSEIHLSLRVGRTRGCGRLSTATRRPSSDVPRRVTHCHAAGSCPFPPPSPGRAHARGAHVARGDPILRARFPLSRQGRCPVLHSRLSGVLDRWVPLLYALDGLLTGR